ncbi:MULTISPECIES: VWA domain-containing protein [unclassified Campylobacter]|uniref:vWA domain-containing protein n=1 Tax=unclassified Campylobacter TaxID=2593542 RepID=UPI0014765FBD|nr:MULTISPECIES: VWA domain-containing protein [unclassified Campylobacter]
MLSKSFIKKHKEFDLDINLNFIKDEWLIYCILQDYSFCVNYIIESKQKEEKHLEQNLQRYQSISDEDFSDEDLYSLLEDMQDNISDFNSSLYVADNLSKDRLISHKNYLLELYSELIEKEFINIKQNHINKVKKLCVQTDISALSSLASELFEIQQEENSKMHGAGNNKTLSKKQKLVLDKYIKMLKQNEIKTLCDMLGKNFKTGNGKTKLNYSNKGNLNKFVKEQISGVTLGHDFENALPSELALIDDPDFGILFDIKFVENRLFCFEKQGFVHKDSVGFESNNYGKSGPIILCIDTSGSMLGEPENISKVLALFISKLATKNKRDVFLINFGINTELLDFSLPANLITLTNFLSNRFGGGTDINPAIKIACEIIKSNPKFKNSDVLAISDMQFEEINQIKPKGIKFYGLVVDCYGSNLNLDPFFDELYQYDCNQKSIKKITNKNRKSALI